MMWKLSSKFPLWMKLYHHQKISEQLSVIIMQMEFKFLVRTWNTRLNVSNCFIAKFTDSRWHLCRIPEKFAQTLVVRFCICFAQAPVDIEAEVQLSAEVTTRWLPFTLSHIKIICGIIPDILRLVRLAIKWWEYGQEWVYVRTQTRIAALELRSALSSAINFNGWCWCHGAIGVTGFPARSKVSDFTSNKQESRITRITSQCCSKIRIKKTSRFFRNH